MLKTFSILLIEQSDVRPIILSFCVSLSQQLGLKLISKTVTMNITATVVKRGKKDQKIRFGEVESLPVHLSQVCVCVCVCFLFIMDKLELDSFHVVMVSHCLGCEKKNQTVQMQ